MTYRKYLNKIMIVIMNKMWNFKNINLYILGNGYVRSEAVVTVFLQKSNVAKRSYATIVEALTNNDGFKDQGITYPSGFMQNQLIQEVYAKCGVNPADVTYVETHGTGTQVWC